MKKMACLIAALVLGSAAYAETVFYVNPQGGTRYHSVRDCPSISSKYHEGMAEVSASALKSGEYAALTPCSVCGVEIVRTSQEEVIVSPGDYVVGVDIPQGLYVFHGEGNLDMLLITKWDGSPYYSHGSSSPWTEVLNIRNEYHLYVPQGCEGRFSTKLNESELDTGTRQLCITNPGEYHTYSDLNPGLYIVEALEEPDTPLRLLNKADDRELRSFQLHKGAGYTIYLGSSMKVELPEGCRLRSFASEMQFQSGEPVLVEQARYVSYQQIPGGKYQITAAPGQEAYYSITTVYDDYPSRRTLEEGESVIVNLNDYDSEVFVELVHCIVTYAIADNG